MSIGLVDKGFVMFVSQKSQYALRSIFELSRHYGKGPIKIAKIAKAQAIPPRFLEVILSQLKQLNIVDSRRGNDGGYFLIRSPKDITVGNVMRFTQGSFDPVGCVAGGSQDRCPLYGDCVFLPMWEEVGNAISNVYDNTSFQDLIDNERQKKETFSFCYSI